MAYIAFFDMVGTRSTASIGEKEYTKAINDFHDAMKSVSDTVTKSRIFAYSDNAYAEIAELSEMITFFQRLRKTMLFKHRYFSAAVDYGSLDAKPRAFGNKKDKVDKGFSMMFTSSETINVYLAQSQFTGIGISLSDAVVKEMDKSEKLSKSYCTSVFLNRPNGDIIRVSDISYNPVGIEELRFVISDYLMTSVMNKRAGRYYITAIISMIRCMDKSIIFDNLDEVVNLVTLKTISHKSLDDFFSYCATLFLLSLFDFIFSLGERTGEIDEVILCETILKMRPIAIDRIIDSLAVTPAEVISNYHKRKLVQIVVSLGKRHLD